MEVPWDTAACPNDGTELSFSGTETPDQEHKDPLIGMMLGEYLVQERLGVGGMGLVYAGLQPVIGKKVAIKVLRQDIAEAREEVERLVAEARAVNQIGHRGII